MNYTENTITLLFLIPILFLAILALYFNVIKPFSEDKAYIKMEIQRAFDESEYRYWKREMKKLYISYIPILGKIITNSMDN